MAVNPTAPLGAPELTEDPGLFPDQLPEGVERTKDFYAYVRRAPDGTEHWEWYKRGTQPGVLGIGRGPDPILTTQVVPPRAARENKTPTVRNINGVPHERQADGTWAPVQTQQGAAQPSAATSSSAVPGNAVPRVEGTPRGDGTFDNDQPIMVWRTPPEPDHPNGRQVDARPLTEAERTRWEREQGRAPTKPSEAPDLVGKPTGNTRQTTKNGTAVKETEYILPDGTREWRTQTATGEATATDQVGKPTGNTDEITRDGKKIKRIEYILPDGTKEWREQASESEKPGRKEVEVVKGGRSLIEVTETDPANNQIRVYHLDPATRQEVTISEASNVKGVPPYTPDLTKPGAGLIDRAKQLDELVAAGTITWDQRNQVLEQDRTLASTVASEFNMGVAILREDYQNQTQQRGQDITNTQHRASLANTHVQNALGLVTKFARYLGETPGDAGKLFTSMMAGQLALATSYGGMKDYPREQLPQTLRNFAERATGAATTPGAVPGATPPNAIGVGAVGNVPAPGGPSTLPSPGPETLPATNTTDAGGVPREFTPSSATNDPSMLAGGPQSQVPPGIAQLFGQSMPPVRQPEEDSWRQQAMNRRDLMLGQRMAGGGLPALPEPQGLDLDASMGPMLAPVLNTSVPGLTPDLDIMARQELEAEWFS